MICSLLLQVLFMHTVGGIQGKAAPAPAEMWALFAELCTDHGRLVPKSGEAPARRRGRGSPPSGGLPTGQGAPAADSQVWKCGFVAGTFGGGTAYVSPMAQTARDRQS